MESQDIPTFLCFVAIVDGLLCHVWADPDRCSDTAKTNAWKDNRLGYDKRSLMTGFFYYCFMSALCTFSTNAINILAGMNGIEGSQTLVISLSIMINDIYQIFTTPYHTTKEAHLLSLYFILPLIGITIGYLMHNWYPARAFGGDTFAYFSGMIIAVTAIQSHFTKTVLLFMIPQIFNFLYSCPQLFKFVPCPRHRMPKYILIFVLIIG
jgi:UDP-N-acetylglucosamine--dolichyl-phosphate N-acetylglucosaminephosphotransferase